jgi:hypothetical protein
MSKHEWWLFSCRENSLLYIEMKSCTIKKTARIQSGNRKSTLFNWSILQRCHLQQNEHCKAERLGGWQVFRSDWEPIRRRGGDDGETRKKWSGKRSGDICVVRYGFGSSQGGWANPNFNQWVNRSSGSWPLSAAGGVHTSCGSGPLLFTRLGARA